MRASTVIVASVASLVSATMMAACAHSPSTTAATLSPPMTSGGDVAFVESGRGTWVDTVGSIWIDGAGNLWLGGTAGMSFGMQRTDLSRLTNSNIVALVYTGDSLEVGLSRLGVEHAQNADVVAFAKRMVADHQEHLKDAMMAQIDVPAMPVSADTADGVMAHRVMKRLAMVPAGVAFDRQFMRAEINMHEHMLRDLNLIEPQSSSTTRQLVDATKVVVKKHITDAMAVARDIGADVDGWK